MSRSTAQPSPRRTFLKTAGVLAVGTAAVGSAACDVKEPATVDVSSPARTVGFDRTLLDALATTVLPPSLGASQIRTITNSFVEWIDGYDPVAEEMHGYGYADIRYLPADPAPAWRAQLAALETLSRKTQRVPFARATAAQRTVVVEAALRTARGDRLPAPLDAPHIAVALISHWCASPAAWNLALGAHVSPGTCRTLDGATRAPLPLAPPTAKQATDLVRPAAETVA